MEKEEYNDTRESNWQLESILRQINVFGFYNLRTLFLLSVFVFVNTNYCVNYVFTAREVKYRCKYQECNNNFMINTTLLSDEGTCTRFLPYANDSVCKIEDYDLTKSVPCEEWAYEENNTFVADFDLACQEWKRVLIGTIHSVGYLVGLLIVGPASDKLGRKIVLIFLTISGGILGVAKSFTTYYWLFVVLEFLEAVFGDTYSPIYMLFVELAPLEYRLLFICLIGVAEFFGGAMMATTAWALPNWRVFVLTLYAPSILVVFLAVFIDESPRWLLSKNRKTEAVAILEKAAKINNKSIDKKLVDGLSAGNCSVEHDSKDTMKNIFSSKIILVRFLICLVLWNTCTFVSYGLLVNAASLPGNLYLNTGILCILDIFVSITVYYVLSKFKRKKPIVCGYILTGIFCCVQPFISQGNTVLLVVFYILGKFTNACVFSALYLFTSELFPTYARNTMHAFCSSVGRIGSILATQTPLLAAYWSGLPTLMFGGAAVVAAILTILIPDTADEILPDNVQQAEKLKNNIKDQIAKLTRKKSVV